MYFCVVFIQKIYDPDVVFESDYVRLGESVQLG